MVWCDPVMPEYFPDSLLGSTTWNNGTGVVEPRVPFTLPADNVFLGFLRFGSLRHNLLRRRRRVHPQLSKEVQRQKAQPRSAALHHPQPSQTTTLDFLLSEGSIWSVFLIPLSSALTLLSEQIVDGSIDLDPDYQRGTPVFHLVRQYRVTSPSHRCCLVRTKANRPHRLCLS